MKETKFLVARNDWCAEQILKKIYQGRVPENEIDKILLPDRKAACKTITKMPFGRQELFSIFQTKFDRSKIVRS